MAIKLTSKLLNKIILEVLNEAQRTEKDHCDDLNVMDKINCHRKDDESRQRSTMKRKKRQQVFPAYDELKALSKGIISEMNPEENNIKYKLKGFIKTLNKPERVSFSKLIKRPTTNELLEFCNDVQSASKGSLDDDRRKEIELRLKTQKAKNKNSKD